jgi:hypothetical protein
MCTDAYREALTRQAADACREGVAAAGAVAESRPAMALAEDATIIHTEVIDRG